MSTKTAGRMAAVLKSWRSRPELRVSADPADVQSVTILKSRRQRLPGRYLAAIQAAIAAFVALPYGEELLRCLRTRSPERADAAAWIGETLDEPHTRQVLETIMMAAAQAQ